MQQSFHVGRACWLSLIPRITCWSNSAVKPAKQIHSVPAMDWTLFCGNWCWVILCIACIVCLCNQGIIVSRRKKVSIVFCIHLNSLCIQLSYPQDNGIKSSYQQRDLINAQTLCVWSLVNRWPSCSRHWSIIMFAYWVLQEKLVHLV
jgi:hypothetical protein